MSLYLLAFVPMIALVNDFSKNNKSPAWVKCPEWGKTFWRWTMVIIWPGEAAFVLAWIILDKLKKENNG